MKLKVPNSKKKVDLQEGSKACHFRLLIPPSLPSQTKKFTTVVYSKAKLADAQCLHYKSGMWLSNTNSKKTAYMKHSYSKCDR